MKTNPCMRALGLTLAVATCAIGSLGPQPHRPRVTGRCPALRRLTLQPRRWHVHHQERYK